MKDGPNGNGPDFLNFALDNYESTDPAMQRCLELSAIAARTDLPILILGDSGTGKTLLAKAIHHSSNRANGAFVSFIGAALSNTLLDSQLFGHEKGAFTGACKTLKGKFELAHKGTLFIDEIADMSPDGQAKILRAVEHGEFERLGSEFLKVADVRIMTATHLPIRELSEKDRFRKDLLYRLSGITIHIPRLADRPNDLRSLVAMEITDSSRNRGKSITSLSREAADILFNYSWPGNLRELKSVLQVAVAVAQDEIVRKDDLLVAFDDHPPYRTRDPEPPTPASTSDLSLESVERRHIEKVLSLMGGNKRRTARTLGISRSTLDRRLTAIETRSHARE